MSLSHEMEQASRMARAAVEMDQQGCTTEAIDLYLKAAEFLMIVLKDPATPERDRQQIRLVMDGYLDRAEALKRAANGTLPAFPAPPAGGESSSGGGSHRRSGGASAASDLAPYVGAALVAHQASGALARQETNANGDPTLLQAAGMGLVEVNKHGGRVVLDAAAKAKQLNSEYDISGKTVRAAQATGRAASSAWTKAKAVNEEHQITEKISTVAKATATKVSELNREYRVTERVGEAFMNGLNFLASKSKEYLEGEKKNEAKPDGAGAAVGSGAAPPRPPPPSKK